MKKTVLLVDDEEGILTLMSRMIEDLGWECYLAKDADSGLRLFKNLYPPLVITDLRLKDGVGGVNLMKEIKNISPITIVVAMSGLYSESYTVSNLRREGFDCLTSKPINVKTIKKLLTAATMCRTSWDEIQGS
jgi:DNA-binding NtrC family response regulator